MDATMTQQRNRIQSGPPTSSGPNASTSSNANTTEIEQHHIINSGSPPPTLPTTPNADRINTTSSFANLLDGFASRVSGSVGSLGGSITGMHSTASTPSGSTSALANAGVSSLASIGSLGTTANAFYSSIGSALNSITSPLTAATTEAAACVLSAASAISNHLSSPTSGTPPPGDELDDDEDCEEDDEEDDENDHRHIPAPTPKKSWAEIKIAVNDMRKQLSNLSTMVPTNIQFRELSDGRLRCYFLSTPPTAWETTLLYADINLKGDDEDAQHLQEVPMDGDDATPTASASRLSSSVGSNSSFGSRMGAISPVNSTSKGFLYGNENSLVFGSNFRKRLQWNLVLQQPTSASTGTNAWSREFQLLQERKRLSTWGITSYELHKSSGKIVFPCFSDLYQCLDTGYNTSPIFPTHLFTRPQWQALDPQICPQNSDLIAYVSGCDIFVTHTISGFDKRLTFAHDGRRPFADDPLIAGLPSYVMQEEFSRYEGYWWQPHSDDGIFRIVYEEVDESDVCIYTFPSSQAVSGEMEEFRFPRAGTANAKSKLKMVQFTLNESLKIVDVCHKDLPYSLSVVFPWLEYIVRVGWTPDSKYVWFQGMDRRQQRLDLVLIPVDNFCETYSSSTSSPTHSMMEHNWKSPHWSEISPLQVIYSQSSDTWINVHDLLYFLEITDSTVTFLWGSEETGFRHMYLITSSLLNSFVPMQVATMPETTTTTTITMNSITTLTNGSYAAVVSNSNTTPMHLDVDCDELLAATATTTTTAPITTTTTASSSSTYSVNMDIYSTGEYAENSATLQPRIINKVALTSGEWEVLGRNIWVDKAKQLVYFLGLRETPLEKHLYVVSLQRPEHIRLLTEPGYSYLVEFDDSCQVMLQLYCNIQRMPSSKIMRVTQTCQSGGVNGIQLSLLGYLHEGGRPDIQYCPQIFRPQLSSGEVVFAMVFKPHDFQLGTKYPTVLNVYGGPEVQTVNNTFKGKHQLRLHMLAAQGYCVVCIDSRGSRHRGSKFESHIRCRMGQVELNDQVDALRILADQLGYIDMNRVAIHGWSYGGYLSLMGLVQYPDIFKIAIAGAPVTNWEYYDTGYTERYMDLPQNNKRGYLAGSVLNYVNEFPDEDHRLLLIHGLIDENVHFYHTSQLITALNKANKPYELHVFPDERHSLRNLESNKNYETKLLSFLQHL